MIIVVKKLVSNGETEEADLNPEDVSRAEPFGGVEVDGKAVEALQVVFGDGTKWIILGNPRELAASSADVVKAGGRCHICRLIVDQDIADRAPYCPVCSGSLSQWWTTAMVEAAPNERPK